MTNPSAEKLVMAALKHRFKHGRHLHHSGCIHNLPPEEQVAILCRGRSLEWYQKMVGPLPEQITPDQWECEPPDLGLTNGQSA